jgi:hypothetical protein
MTIGWITEFIRDGEVVDCMKDYSVAPTFLSTLVRTTQIVVPVAMILYGIYRYSTNSS